MRRKLIGIFIIFILLFNNLSVFAAVTPDVYYSNVRVALKSMSSKQMKLVLNGDYILRLKVKNQSEQEFESFKTTLQSGTSIEIKVESDKIKYLDKACDILELEPVLSDSNLTIISNYTRSYLGHFRFIISSGNILPINKIDVENYLVGVIGHEIGFNVPFEAHKVQAVATRTYALEKVKFSNTFDLYDDESSQVYKGVLVGQELKYKDNIIKAIEETKGEVLTYKGNLISAYFSASNGGYTELSSNVWAADLPYIVSRYDEYDDPSKISNQKKMQWTKSFTTKQMEEIMLANETLSNGHCFSKIDLESITRFESGRIKNMYLECYFIINSHNIKKLLNTDKELVDVRLDNINSEPIYRFSLNEGTINLKLTEIDLKLKKLGYMKRNVDNFKFIKLEDIKKDENGNIVELKIYYNKTLDKTSSRNFLDIVDKENNKKKVTLLSSLYDISYIESSDTYKFSGKGYGHGVGMSQYGVINRAYAGQKYSDILEFYFPKTNLTNLNVILKSIETDKSELIVKQPVTIKVNTYDLNNKFSFVVYKDSEEIKRIEDTQANIMDFVPNDIGIYKVVIKIKKEGSNRDYDVINTISLKVFNKPKINEINILQDKIYEKKNVSFRIDVVNGTTKGRIYEFEVIKDGKSIFNKGQDSNVFSYTPVSSGEYVLKVRIKDKMSTNQWDDEKEIKFSVQKEPIRLNINRTLKKGMKGTDVKILQEALIKLKYLKYSKPNSVYDTATLYAVKNLQKANKLKDDGVFGAGTKKVLEDRLNGVAIGSITNRTVTSTNIIYLNVGSKGQDVLKLQNRLKQLGYLNAKYVTGYFGTVTQNALKTYQKANKLPQTGVLDSATYNKIYK